MQQRNLEAALARPVLDRVNVIIDIFGQRARTREAKLQVVFHNADESLTCLWSRSIACFSFSASILA